MEASPLVLQSPVLRRSTLISFQRSVSRSANCSDEELLADKVQRICDLKNPYCWSTCITNRLLTPEAAA